MTGTPLIPHKWYRWKDGLVFLVNDTRNPLNGVEKYKPDRAGDIQSLCVLNEVFFSTLICATGSAYPLFGFATGAALICGGNFWLDTIFPGAQVSVESALVLAPLFVLSLLWWIIVPLVCGHLRLSPSYVWLTSIDGERTSFIYLRAAKNKYEQIEKLLKQQGFLTAKIKGVQVLPPNLSDLETLVAEERAGYQKQIDAIQDEIKQLATQSEEIVSIATTCAAVMERLRVAGLGGSWLSLPDEDPLPFMQRFIADGKARLKAWQEVNTTGGEV